LLANEYYDVVVIGAGPAGGSAAYAAACAGVRTILIEKHPEIGQPVCCAEGITAFGLERVFRPEPEWISAVIEGATLVGPDNRPFTIHHPNAGYILNRELFDKWVANKAADAGAEIATSAPVVKIEMKDGIKAVFAGIGDSLVRIEGKVFIAADGVESRIAHMAGIDTSVSLDKIDSACQYFVENIDIDDKMISIFIGNRIAPGGYAWVFPKSDRHANIGVAICPARAAGHAAIEYLDSFISRRFPDARVLRITVGGIPRFDRKMPLTMNNLMIVGDAGRVLDSLSGAGISNALLSGQIAGEVAAGFIRGKTKLQEYPRRFGRLKARELRAYSLFKSILVGASDLEFGRIFDAVTKLFPEKKVRDVNIPDIIFKLVLRNPNLLAIARRLKTR
jgi:digeranylgeranylglycerophospholipid reductase